MKWGTLQNVLGEPLPDVFSVAARLGFEGVELDWHKFEDAHDGVLAPSERAGIRQAAQEAGVEIHSVAAHFLNVGGLSFSDEAKQQFGLDAVREGIALCRDLGATALLVPFFGPAELTSDEDVARLKTHLQTLAPEAESAGVTLGIEGTLRGDDAARLLEEVGSPFVGAYWDMANCMSLGFDPLDEVRLLRGHIARVHAKEFAGEVPQNRPQGRYPGLNTVALGQGSVPIRDVLALLREGGYDGWITLETGAFGDRHESARQALEVLKAAV